MKSGCACVLCCALSFVAPALAAPPKPPDTKAVAEKVVAEVAGVKEGEVVFISGNAADVQLLEDLHLAAAKRGALAQRFSAQTGFARRLFDEVPAKYDANRAALDLKLAALPDVAITVSRNDAPGALKGVAPERLAALGKAYQPVQEKARKRGTRQVELGNGLFPSKGNALEAGVTEEELAALFWAGLATDYAKLAAKGEAVRAAVRTGKVVRVTTKAGTDLSFKLAAKPLLVSDGVISAEKQKKGGAALLTWLPAGEAYGLVQEGSAEGKVVARVLVDGEEVKDLTVTVKGGHAVDFTASPSKAFDTFKARYAAAVGAKDALSIVDFGLNPDVKAPKGKVLYSFIPEGAVTLVLGNDVWAGGNNTTPFEQPFFLPDATLTVDGKAVVENGVLKP